MHYFISLAYVFTCVHHLAFTNGQKQDNSRLNFFDTDLLRYTAEDKRGNVMIAPASIKSTLAMILEGAAGSTAEEIRSALRLSPFKEEYREQLNLYLSLLQANTTGSFLQNANAVFVSSKLKLRKNYEMMLKKVYMSEVCYTEFRDPIPAVETINSWISSMTKGLIQSIVEPVHINPATDILLINALYFKSSWQNAFNPRNTRSGCFYNQGVCQNTAMMELYREMNYAFVDNLRSHAVELPYEGGHYSMVILVPQDRDGSAALIRDLPYMSLAQISKLMQPNDVMLTLPKFTVDYCQDMIGPLRNLRITSLFSPKADLSGIFEGESPHINNIFHKVHLEVDEVGTVAAAATGAMVVPLMQSGVQLHVDRPFVFFIRDNKHGLVLFEGRIDEPSSYVENNGLTGNVVSGKNTSRNRHYKKTSG